VLNLVAPASLDVDPLREARRKEGYAGKVERSVTESEGTRATMGARAAVGDGGPRREAGSGRASPP
jgi:hypothetical protein